MDAALVEAVVATTGPARIDLLDTLVARRHAPSLARVVGRYGCGSAVLDQLLVDRVRGLESGLRVAVGSESAPMRASAIALIVDANDPAMAYLLAQAIGHADGQTRQAAGDGLHVLTTRFLQSRALHETDASDARFKASAKQLASALGQAILRWEHHTHRHCLASAMWMGLDVRDDIARKLDQPRNELRRPIERLLDRTKDTRLASFVLAALSIPSLRAVAVRTIILSRDVSFLDAVVRQTFVWQDDKVRRGCRWIKRIEWLDLVTARLLGRDDEALAGVVDLLSACGAPVTDKLRLYRRLLDEAPPPVRRLALEAAKKDVGGPARSLLNSLAIRSSDELAVVARGLLSEPGDTVPNPLENEPGSDLVGRYFRGELPLVKLDRVAMRSALNCLPGGAVVGLRRRLASGDPLVKARALQLARAVGVVSDLSRQVYELVHDADPVVRSIAVSLLAILPGPTSQRLARASLDDGDDRVRASGVEAMDELHLDDRAAISEPFLSSRCQRLRANAVKSLLTLSVPRAGETLLDMLADPSPAHRISALWVAERLRLRSVAKQVRELATRDVNDRVQSCARRVLLGFAKTETRHATGTAATSLSKGGAA